MGKVKNEWQRNAARQFNKATAHEIVKGLKGNHLAVLSHFKVDEKKRKFKIWQRGPLAILMDSWPKFEQKLNYSNPLAEKWNLAQRCKSKISLALKHSTKHF
ncbi:MAG: hypothetical protein M3512_13055 [Bacteroidota bacterium]|nr:hypothetical protein [Bacteroidota bacterium]